jgi:iron-sulfur cluster assembly protein
MVTASPRAIEELREQLLHKLIEGGIGLRILVNIEESGSATFSIKVDKHQRGDEVIDSGNMLLFVDPLSAARIQGCQLDYQDGTNEGFLLRVFRGSKDECN